MMLTGVLLVVIAATVLLVRDMRATVTDGLVVVALMSATFTLAGYVLVT